MKYLASSGRSRTYNNTDGRRGDVILRRPAKREVESHPRGARAMAMAYITVVCTTNGSSYGRNFLAICAPLRHFFGLAALILSTLLTNILLLWVRDSHEGFSSNAVLALGNLCLGLGVFWPSHLTIRLRQNLLLLVWSACYCFIYTGFLVWPRLLPLPLLMTALALAPMLAVVVSGDWLRVRASTSQKLAGITPLLLLLVLAPQLSPLGITLQGVCLFFAVSLAIVGSQAVARILSRQFSPVWTSVHLSLINGLVLLFVLSSVTAVTPLLNVSVARDSIGLGIGILLIQVLYLWGLKNSAAIPSGLCLALSVPIAVWIEALHEGHTPSLFITATTTTYFLAATFVSIWQGTQKVTPACESSFNV